MTGRGTGDRVAQGPGAMMADVLAGVSRLVQGELALAKAEASERLQSAKQAVVQVAVATVLGIVAVNVLAAAAVALAVAAGLSAVWASVLVGGGLLLLALGIAQDAARRLREAGALPKRSAASVRHDVETLQTMVKPNAAS